MMKKEIKVKKIDANELAQAMVRLSEEDRFKIFHMIKGIELINESNRITTAI